MSHGNSDFGCRRNISADGERSGERHRPTGERPACTRLRAALCIRAECRRGKAPGEPYEGKLHVRFDEGVLETELWSGLRHRCKGESLRKQKSPLLWPLRQRPTLQMRNVKRHLAKRHWPEVIRRLNAAYHESDHEKALRSLKTTAAWLERISPDAAASLREGLEETLTVVRLGLPADLPIHLNTTNPIESALSVTRRLTRRVTRWREGNMRQRWCAAGLLQAEKKFRRLKAYRHLSQLVSKLDSLVGNKQTLSKTA